MYQPDKVARKMVSTDVYRIYLQGRDNNAKNKKQNQSIMDIGDLVDLNRSRVA